MGGDKSTVTAEGLWTAIEAVVGNDTSWRRSRIDGVAGSDRGLMVGDVLDPNCLCLRHIFGIVQLLPRWCVAIAGGRRI